MRVYYQLSHPACVLSEITQLRNAWVLNANKKPIKIILKQKIVVKIPGSMYNPAWLIAGLSSAWETAILKPFAALEKNVWSKLSTSKTSLRPLCIPFLTPLGIPWYNLLSKFTASAFLVSGLIKFKYGTIRQQGPNSVFPPHALKNLW